MSKSIYDEALDIIDREIKIKNGVAVKNDR